MTFSDNYNPDFKVMITECQITQKWYNKWYNGQPIKSRIGYIERRHFQRLWKTHATGFKVTTSFDAEYLRNGTSTR